MTILLAGSAFADLRTYFGAASSHSATYISTAVCLEGITLDTSTYYATLQKWTPAEAGFFKYRFNSNGGTVRSAAIIELLDDSDNPVLRLYSAGSNIVVLQYDSGGWTTVGAGSWTYLLGIATIEEIVIEWNHSASGALGFYVDGVEKSRVEGDFSALPDIASARFWRTTTSNADYYSEWIASTDNNISYRFYMNPPNAAGTHTAWSGAYTDIDEVGINTSDFISSATADQKSTFKAAARTFASPVEVKAVVVSFYGRKGSSGPTQVAPLLRVGGTDYEMTTRALGFGYKPFTAIVETNPVTGVAFTRTEANDVNLEFGFKSVA